MPFSSMKPAPATLMVGHRNNSTNAGNPCPQCSARETQTPSSPTKPFQFFPKSAANTLSLFRKKPLRCSLSHTAKSQPGTSGLQLFLQLFEQHSWECFKLIAPAVEQRGLKTPTDKQHVAAMCLLAEDQMNVSPGWVSWAPLSHQQLLMFRPMFLCSLHSDGSLIMRSSFQQSAAAHHKRGKHLP